MLWQIITYMLRQDFWRLVNLQEYEKNISHWHEEVTGRIYCNEQEWGVVVQWSQSGGRASSWGIELLRRDSQLCQQIFIN